MQDQDRIPVETAEWRWALIRSGLPGAARHIALTLAVRMDRDGTIPSRFKVGVRRIAADAGVHRNTVMPALRALLEEGFLDEVEPAAGTRPARYRASVPRHSGCAAEGPAGGSPVAQHEDHRDPAVAQQGDRWPVDDHRPAVDNRPESVDTAGDGGSLWHNGNALVAQRDRSSGTTTGPHPAVPAEPAPSSTTQTSEHGPRRFDDLDRGQQLRWLRAAQHDLDDQGVTDPPIEQIREHAGALFGLAEARA